MRLADLIGQDTARTALLRAIERGHLAHAYLFDGPPGVGKRSAALRAWRWRSTARPRPGTGCGACEICRRIDAGIHPDVPTFGPTGAGGQIVMDAAQAILALARTRPHEAAARVIVIDDADAMNPSAANCLLKTLEEPLARNHLVLCTSVARSPAADDPVAHADASASGRCPTPELLELARRHGIPARARGDRGDAGRRIGGAPVRGRGGGRRRCRGADAGRAARGGRRAGHARRSSTSPPPQASDKPGKAGKDDLGRAARPARAPVPRRARPRGGRARAGGAARHRGGADGVARAGGAGRRAPEPRARRRSSTRRRR